jgi:hypothetical protein
MWRCEKTQGRMGKPVLTFLNNGMVLQHKSFIWMAQRRRQDYPKILFQQSRTNFITIWKTQTLILSSCTCGILLNFRIELTYMWKYFQDKTEITGNLKPGECIFRNF